MPSPAAACLREAALVVLGAALVWLMAFTLL